MDDVISVLIVAAMAAIGLISKVMEQKKAKAEEAKVKPKPVRAEDLPPETRRMLYGTTDVPAVKAAAPRTARVRELVQQQQENAPTIAGEPLPERPVRRPQFQVRVAKPAPPREPGRAASEQPRPVAPRPARRRPAAPPVVPRRASVPAAPSLRQRVEEMKTQLQKTLEEAMEQALPQTPQTPPPRPARLRKPVPMAQTIEPREGPAPVRSGPLPPTMPDITRPRRKPALARQMFRGRADVRRGIILSEVLGPPVGLR